MAEGAAQFIRIAPPPRMDHRRTATLALRRLRPLKRRRIVRQYPPPHDILAGHMKIALRAQIVRLRRMPRQRNAMLRTPVVQLRVPRLLHPQRDRPLIIRPVPLRVRLVIMPQRRQMRREIIPQQPVHMRQDPRRPRPHPALTRFAYRARLIRKDRRNQPPKVRPEPLIELIVNKADKACHRLRIKQIPSRRFILFRAAVNIMQPPNISVHLAVDHRQPFTALPPHHRHQRLIRLQPRLFPLRQPPRRQTARLIARILLYHLPCRRPRRIHPLIVQHHLHPPPLRLLDRHIIKFQQRLRHPPQRARQPHPRMNNEPMHPMRLKIPNLPPNLIGVQIIVPKPKRQHRKLRRRVDKCIKCRRHFQVLVVNGNPIKSTPQ